MTGDERLRMMLHKRRSGTTIEHPCNDEYYRLCREQGETETRNILREHDLARLDAAEIIIR